MQVTHERLENKDAKLSKANLYAFMIIIVEFCVVRFISRYAITLIVATVFPDLPFRTSDAFAMNVARIAVNTFMTCYVLGIYRYRYKENVWAWAKKSNLRFLLPSLVVPAVFFARISLNGGIRNLALILYPFQSEALSAIITTPFAEELFYRGFLLRRLHGVAGKWPAIIISSVFFGLSHGDFVQAFIPGVLLGTIYTPPKEGSEFSISAGYLWVAIILHMLLNIKTV